MGGACSSLHSHMTPYTLHHTTQDIGVAAAFPAASKQKPLLQRQPCIASKFTTQPLGLHTLPPAGASLQQQRSNPSDSPPSQAQTSQQAFALSPSLHQVAAHLDICCLIVAVRQAA